MLTPATKSNHDGGKSIKQRPEESAKVGIRQIGQNTCGLFDFAYSKGNEIIGVGIGSEVGVASANKSGSLQNKQKDIFFVCNSNDLGKTWQGEREIPYESTGPISGITERNGTVFIWGANGFIWAKNEAKWQSVFEPKSEIYRFRYIEFLDNKTGFAASETEYGTQIFKTQDGGKSWNKVYENEISGHPFDLLVVDKDTAIIAINDEYIIRTEDGGKTWKAQELESTGRTIKEDDWISLTDNGASDLTLASDGVVWVVGKKGSLYYSDDKGKTWKRPDKMPNSIKEQELKSIAFSPSGNGVAVGQNGYIIISHDAGKTWNEIPQNAVKKHISENDVTKNPDKLIKVKFKNENAIVLGLLGVYEISF
jgi:photosystem II stability/assembly factor-like uncharacterized protein